MIKDCFHDRRLSRRSRDLPQISLKDKKGTRPRKETLEESRAEKKMVEHISQTLHFNIIFLLTAIPSLVGMYVCMYV